MNTYRPEHFALVELVDPVIFQARGDRCWELLQVSALQTLEQLRKVFGPIIVNNWHSGGPHKESGLRQFTTATGNEYSMHKYGGAYDCKFKSTSPKEAATYILAHPDEFPLLTTLENVDKTISWLHFDVRNHSKKGIWVVDP
jgi:hypothetical protein